MHTCQSTGPPSVLEKDASCDTTASLADASLPASLASLVLGDSTWAASCSDVRLPSLPLWLSRTVPGNLRPRRKLQAGIKVFLAKRVQWCKLCKLRRATSMKRPRLDVILLICWTAP